MTSNSDEVPPIYEDDAPTFAVSDKTYDILRFLVVILIPALGTAYFALASLLGLPAAEQVVGTLTIVDTLLGVMLRSLRRAFEKSDARFDGAITVLSDDEAGTSDVHVSLDPKALVGKDEVRVKVKQV